jgi:tetratricopeptide (TPR) repeat protein
MFPHDKLDWNLSRLEKQLEKGQPDADLRLAYAKACVSKGRFHGGDESWFDQAVTHARRVLHQEPGHPQALILGGLGLVLLDRAEPAQRYLESAREAGADQPMLHMAYGELRLQAGDVGEAIVAFQRVCQLAPDAWESHLLLGHLLAELTEDPETPKRQLERAQYHLVRALQLESSATETPGLVRALAMLCLRTERISDAQRLFHRLLNDSQHRPEARYQLGRVAARLGKHKKAILYFRQHISETTEQRAEVWAQIGASYLHLREPQPACKACNRALAIDPDDLEARWYLGAALLELEQPEEAVRAFREILERAPDHHDAFTEMVRLRTTEGDVRWLRQALRSETAVYDRLPVETWRLAHRARREVKIDPRACTRNRIDAILHGLGRIDEDVTTTALECLDLTTDEGLRFRLWEGVLDLLARQRAEAATQQLQNAGTTFGASAGRDVLTLSHLLSEEELIRGLHIGEEDLRRAAVERHGPAEDVSAHRENVTTERSEARAWQALLLIAIAGLRTSSARNLLMRWASEADPELSLAAQAGLAMTGDADASQAILTLASTRQLDHLAKRAVAPAGVPGGPDTPRLEKERDDLLCATCGRRGSQVGHMVVGRGYAVCNGCMVTIWDRRRELNTRDPDVTCSLTGASLLDTKDLYLYQGVAVSEQCVDISLGHDEREAIASFLASM